MPQSTMQRSDHSLPIMSEFIAGAGLGCNMAWVNMTFKSMGIFASYSHGEQLLDIVYLISIVAVTLTLFLSGFFDRPTEKFLRMPTARLALPVAVALCTVLMPFAGLDGIWGSIFTFGAGALSGVFSGLFFLYFGLAFSRLTMKDNVIGAAAASIVSSLLFSLFLLFDPVAACVFAASMPLVAVALLELGAGRNAAFPEIAEEHPRGHRSEQESHANDQDQKAWHTLVGKMALCSFLVGFSNELVRTLYVQMGISGAGGTSYSLAQFIATFGATLVVIGISLALIGSKLEPRAKSCYRILSLLLVAGALLLPLPLLQSEITVRIPHAMNAAAYTCFGMFVWILVSAICAQYGQKRLRIFAFVRATWAAGPLLGLLLGRFILHTSGLEPLPVFLAMFVAVISLVLVNSTVFTESDLVYAMNIMPLERRRRFQLKCANVVGRYGLSEREGEIMIMLAKGRNLPFIQDQLHLSKSTISTHRQHIYQKLDIHSQQELMDMVDASPLE